MSGRGPHCQKRDGHAAPFCALSYGVYIRPASRLGITMRLFSVSNGVETGQEAYELPWAAYATMVVYVAVVLFTNHQAEPSTRKSQAARNLSYRD